MGVRKPNMELKEHKTWVGMIDFPDVECYNEVTKTNNRDSNTPSMPVLGVFSTTLLLVVQPIVEQ